MNIDDMINGLIGLKYNEKKSDSVPSYLSKKYDREGSAIALGESGLSDPRILGALCQACFQDEEEDVRQASLEALYKLEPKLGTSIAHCLTKDNEESVSDCALEIIENYNFLNKNN